MNRALAATLCVCLFGCENEPEGPCYVEERTNSIYLLTYKERSGNCGPIPEQLVSAATAKSDPNCEGWYENSPDNCRVLSTLSCYYPDVGEELEMVGQVDWEPGGAKANGIVDIWISDPYGRCSSTYDVTYRRR